ncbi:sensor histidine kinase [Panacagrimonas sp.]|uniref:sensor histidine kinase n=1 Tax=Panacagrimonas sp. TaxID=2480088 RepID=UPI003B519B0B
MSIYQRLFLWFCAVNIVTLGASILIAYAIFERRADRAPDIAPLAAEVQHALAADLALPDDRRSDGRRWVLIREGRQLDGSAPPRVIERHLEDLLADRAELRLPRGLWMVSQRLESPHADTHLILLQSPPQPRPWQRAVLPGLQILLSVLAIAAVGWVVARHLAAPLEKIQSVVRRVAAGQLGSRVGGELATRNDEYGRLARDFDRMAAQIESLVDSRDQLLHDVSHEMRAPLSRLRFALELAREDADGNSFERADREIGRIDALVGQLLTLARLEQPANRRELEAVDLLELAQDVVEAERPQAEHRGVSLAIRGPALSAQGERDALMRALENLIRNAVRHAPAGSEVEIVIGGDSGEAFLQVLDRGRGVPVEDLPRLFEPFFRSRDSGTESGHGLGLAIVARILRAHRGRAEAQLREGGGLDVSLRWPRSAAVG